MFNAAKSTSGQAGVNRAGFTLLPEITTAQTKIHEAGFQDTGHRTTKAVAPQEQDTNKVSSPTALLYGLKRRAVSKTRCAQVELRQSQAGSGAEETERRSSERTEYHRGDHCREIPVTNNTGSVEEPAGRRESSHTAAGNGKWYNQFWKKLGGSSQS